MHRPPIRQLATCILIYHATDVAIKRILCDREQAAHLGNQLRLFWFAHPEEEQ